MNRCQSPDIRRRPGFHRGTRRRSPRPARGVRPPLEAANERATPGDRPQCRSPVGKDEVATCWFAPWETGCQDGFVISPQLQPSPYRCASVRNIQGSPMVRYRYVVNGGQKESQNGGESPCPAGHRPLFHGGARPRGSALRSIAGRAQHDCVISGVSSAAEEVKPTRVVLSAYLLWPITRDIPIDHCGRSRIALDGA